MRIFFEQYAIEIAETVLMLAAILLSLLLFARERTRRNLIIFSIIVPVLCVADIACSAYLFSPDIQVVGGEKITVEAGHAYIDRGVTVTTFNGEKVDVIVSVDNTVDTAAPGVYPVNYTFRYRYHVYGATREVKVVDTTPPVLTLKGADEVVVDLYEDYKEKGCKAVDAIGGNVTAQVKTSSAGDPDKRMVITYTATDPSGNTASLNRTVLIEDRTPPVVTLKGYKSEIVVRGKKFTDAGATAKDRCDGDVTGSVTVSGEVNTHTAGTYYINYTAADKRGNTVVETRTVKVVTPESVKGNVIYLTFDDGPSNQATAQILDALKENNVKATFFIINFNTKEKAALVKRIVREGHTLAIHGYSHDYYTIYKSEKAFMKNVDSLRDKIYALTGYTPTLLRCPGGSSNTVSAYNPGIMTRLTKKVSDAGYLYFDWNIDSGDTDGSKVTASRLCNNTVYNLRKNRGNIVLMHDTGNGAEKAKAVQMIIDYAEKHGYVFAGITEATIPVHHPVRN